MPAPGTRRGALAVLVAMLAGTGVGSAQDRPAPEVVSGRSWTIEGRFDRGEATDLSGLACAPAVDSRRACLVVSDETLFARHVVLEDGLVRLGGTIPLLPPEAGGERFKDTDAEAAAYADGVYYVAGSHGASRRRGEYERSRFFVYRLASDPASGRAVLPPGASVAERSDRLEGVLADLPELRDHACRADRPCRPLGEGGLNIEALAARDGRLFFGLRAPSLDGRAFVVAVAVEALFGPETPRPEISRPALGPGIGIRDMAGVADGFLLLTGSERPEPDTGAPAATIVHWSGTGDRVTPLATLPPGRDGAKPEVLLLLDGTAAGYRVLVLSDGPLGGEPTEYALPRGR